MPPPKKRYEHIHVRLAVAILGHRHFWKGEPHSLLQSFQLSLRDSFSIATNVIVVM